jgi:acyl carrier protein phosphodiesterase
MPAPRLLDKKRIAASLADERRLEIDKGIKLAKKIDFLRETLAEEETKLERFRTETVKKVQIEIDMLIHERDRLKQEITRLSI